MEFSTNKWQGKNEDIHRLKETLGTHQPTTICVDLRSWFKKTWERESMCMHGGELRKTTGAI